MFHFFKVHLNTALAASHTSFNFTSFSVLDLDSFDRNSMCLWKESIFCSCWISIYFLACVCMCAHAKLLQSCTTLCDPIECWPPDSPVHEILQSRKTEWVTISSSQGLSQGMETASPVSPALAGGIFNTKPPEKPIYFLRSNWLIMLFRSSILTHF